MTDTSRYTTATRTISASEADTAIDAGHVWARMHNGNWWKCRRNGRTQSWKTRPAHFRLPIKAGLRATGAIDHDTHFGADCDFQIAETQPNARKR